MTDDIMIISYLVSGMFHNKYLYLPNQTTYPAHRGIKTIQQLSTQLFPNK